MTFQRIFYDALDNSYEILRFALARTFSSNNADLLSVDVNNYKLSTKEIKYKNRLTTNLNIDLYIY